jgi:hypothetical protein
MNWSDDYENILESLRLNAVYMSHELTRKSISIQAICLTTLDCLRSFYRLWLLCQQSDYKPISVSSISVLSPV